MKSLLEDLASVLPPERLRARPYDRYAYARDASFYRLIPQAVVQPRTEQEIVALFEYARGTGTPLVFRGGGTSLSGQAITDGILVEIGRHWRGHEIGEAAATITLQPGIIGARANQLLQPHGRKIGPDPASLQACFVGGIIANNASGMCCGVAHNSYHTLAGIRFILPNGLTFDTDDPGADSALQRYAPELHQGIRDLRQDILEDETLTDRIRDKYQRKNTMGYSLNAFLDYDEPLQILAHLLVGSEGTLGFISRVTLKTLPDPPLKATALLLFNTLEAAAEQVVPLADAGAAALEIMDRASLRAIESKPGMPAAIADLPPDGAALLCELQATTPEELLALRETAEAVLAKAPLAVPATFTEDARERLRYWQVRKGLFPAVGAVRKTGTTVIIEDICFRQKDLAPAIRELQALFKKHAYHQAIIFGHAKDGNLHFVLSQAFNDDDGVRQYEALMDDVVRLTREQFDGTLKAEHGTGRNMAPFLETEWGPEAVAIMRRLKALVDPANILNPGVILNDDRRCHLRDLKPLPGVSPIVDRCIECGFCEPVCPSAALTTSPRRRIAVARELALLQAEGEASEALVGALTDSHDFEAITTCATDGLCATSCPVDIDTGELMRELRANRHGGLASKLAGWSAQRFDWTLSGARLGLSLGHKLEQLLGLERLQAMSAWTRRVSGGHLPGWHAWMPRPATPLPPPRARPGENREEIVYFPACLTRGMGRMTDEPHTASPTEIFMDLLREANIHARYPQLLGRLCCGQPYASKGFAKVAREMAERLTDAFWDASDHGRLPIVIDTSTCAYRVKTYDQLLSGKPLLRWRKLRILDVIEFLHDTLLERVLPTEQPVPVILHPTCATTKMELNDKLRALAERCAARVYIADQHGCCGMAGDRGLLVPELTASATEDEAREIAAMPTNAACYSSCRTCEMGMAQATDRPWSSILYLVHDAVCTRGRPV